jgi:hypothetical protein
MIVGMLVFGLICGFFIVTAITCIRSKRNDIYVLSCLAAFFFLPFRLCLYQFFKQSYDVLVFQNQHTGGQIIFLNNVPSAEALTGFIDRLRSEIKNHRGKLPVTPKSFSQELEALARLRDSGVLSEVEFPTAKQNLIDSAKATGSIGYGN